VADEQDPRAQAALPRAALLRRRGSEARPPS
jgi:hypothetical protein